jgi:hypothetical protein
MKTFIVMSLQLLAAGYLIYHYQMYWVVAALTGAPGAQ